MWEGLRREADGPLYEGLATMLGDRVPERERETHTHTHTHEYTHVSNSAQYKIHSCEKAHGAVCLHDLFTSTSLQLSLLPCYICQQH